MNGLSSIDEMCDSGLVDSDVMDWECIEEVGTTYLYNLLKGFYIRVVMEKTTLKNQIFWNPNGTTLRIIFV